MIQIDMEMPKSCGSCVYNESSCRCSITKSPIDRDYEYRERLSDCPLKEVPTGKWIPCSERLPDKDKYDHGKVWERSVLVTKCFSWNNNQTFISMTLAKDVIANKFEDECIVAWMPLPEPYKEEELCNTNNQTENS